MHREHTTSTPIPVTYARNVVQEPRSGPKNNRRRSLVLWREEIPAPTSAPVPIPARRSSNTAATHQLSLTAYAPYIRYPTSSNGSVPNLFAMTSTPRITQISNPHPLGSNRPSAAAPPSITSRSPPAISVRPRSTLSRTEPLAYVPAPTPAPAPDARKAGGFLLVVQLRLHPRLRLLLRTRRPSLAITCPLCLDSADTLTSTLCGHVFC